MNNTLQNNKNANWQVSKRWRFIFGPLILAGTSLIGGIVYETVFGRAHSDGANWGGLVVVATAPLYGLFAGFLIPGFVRNQKVYFPTFFTLLGLIAVVSAYFTMMVPAEKRQSDLRLKAANDQYERAVLEAPRAMNIKECGSFTHYYDQWKVCVGRTVKTASDFTLCQQQAKQILAQDGNDLSQFCGAVAPITAPK